MLKEKKKWETPKLICLYKGRPEEAVLVGCKDVAMAGPPATNPSGKCQQATNWCAAQSTT